MQTGQTMLEMGETILQTGKTTLEMGENDFADRQNNIGDGRNDFTDRRNHIADGRNNFIDDLHYPEGYSGMKGELLKPGAGWMEPSVGLEKVGGIGTDDTAPPYFALCLYSGFFCCDVVFFNRGNSMERFF